MFKPQKYNLVNEISNLEEITFFYGLVRQGKIKYKVVRLLFKIVSSCDRHLFSQKKTKSAFLLSELAGQTCQFAKKVQQFERTLA